MSRTTVADVVVDGLRRAGAPRIFGVPGPGAPLPLLDAARAAGLPVVLAYDESAACVMAAVTADLCGAPGVASVGASAGVVAAAAGVAHAVLDRSPLVLLTGRHPRGVLGCKATVVVEAASAAARTAHAVRVALAAPCGPVHLEVPEPVVGRDAERPATPYAPEVPPRPAPGALEEAARLLARAARPLLVLGQHCRAAADAPWLRAFAEALPAPALVTAKAKGALPDPHPLVLGVVTGEASDDRALGRADLLVALGLDAAEPVPRAWWSRLPVLAIGPAPASDGPPAFCEVTGGVGAVLEELAPRLADRPRADWDVAELDRLKREWPAPATAAPAGLAPQRVVELAREAMEPDTLAAVDAGAHWDAVTGFWQAVAPGEFLAPNGATRAFALPATLAAHLARPARRVVGFTDAAGLLAAAAELETAKRLAAPIVLVVFGGADAVRLAQSFGVAAYAADSEPAVAQGLGRARQVRGPAVLSVFAT